MTTPALAHRANQIDQLKSQTFDVLVIGGGITGAGIARDAALRGYKTALVEKQDFASGTSSNSARLAHGGLRYVETLELGVVRQASSERQILQRIAPHQVAPIPFLIPMSHSLSRRLKVRLGLWVYDLVGLYQNVHTSDLLSPRQVAEVEPGVSVRAEHGAMRYWERVIDDARLTLSTILSSVQHGALALNYAEVVELLKSNGRLHGAAIRDSLSGQTFEVKAAQVVNASGPWNDTMRRLDDSSQPPSVRPNKGIHVVVPHAKFPVHGAIDFPAAGKIKRTMYAVHWHQTTLIGTTDTDYDGDLDAAHAHTDEVAWILDSVNAAFAGTHLSEADIVSTFAGLRPLVHTDTAAAYKATREHQITISPSGLISIAGGKFTTHRAMAQDVMDEVATHLKNGQPGRSDQVPLDARLKNQQDILDLTETAHSAAAELDEDVIQHLVSTYGSASLDVLKLTVQDAHLKQRIVEGLPYIYAEIPYTVTHEMASSLSDVLMRRTRLLHEVPQQGLAQAGRVAAHMAPLLGWTEAETAKQLNDYRQQVALTRRFDTKWVPAGGQL